IYLWVDGIHVQARLENDAQCLRVIAPPSAGCPRSPTVEIRDGETLATAAALIRFAAELGDERQNALNSRPWSCLSRPTIADVPLDREVAAVLDLSWLDATCAAHSTCRVVRRMICEHPSSRR